MHRRISVCLTVVASILFGVAASANARVFYVSASGHNWRNGRSLATAWRTVGRVNRASLRPGDVVEFQGGSVFSDAQLMPHNSGSGVAPIVFTSYGGRKATLSRGVWFASIAWITFDGLGITGAPNGIVSGYGSGARHIVISHDAIYDVGIAVNSTNRADSRWAIVSNRIAHTGDSGVVIQGSSDVILSNQILHTGTDRAIPYDRHGIYSKGPRAEIIGNHIVDFSAQGISTRYHDAFISGNSIANGAAGVGYWQDDRRGGTTVICGNVISGVHYGVLIGPQSGSSRERFRILDNHIGTTGGPGVYDPYGRPALSFTRNVVSRHQAARIRSARASDCLPAQAGAASVAAGLLAGPLGAVVRALTGA